MDGCSQSWLELQAWTGADSIALQEFRGKRTSCNCRVSQLMEVCGFFLSL